MTKQDKTMVQIGPIKFSKGFKGSLSYPKDRLERFLNTDPTDEQAITKFCSDYKYLPRYYYVKRSLPKAFQREQKPLKEIAKRAVTNKLTQKDVVTINKHLPTKQLRVTLTNRTQLSTLPNNDEIQPPDPSRDHSRYLIDEYSLSGTLSTLWEDLVRLALTTQNLRTCANCGQFFTKLNNREKTNCSYECQQARKKRKQRKKK